MSAQRVTLDAVAACLVQAEPGDLESVAALRDACQGLAAARAYPEIILDLVSRAAQELTACLDGTNGDAAETLTGVGRLVETAQRILDMDDMGFDDGPIPAKSAPVERGANPPAAAPAPAAASPRTAPSSADRSTIEAFEPLPADLDMSMMADFISESRDNIHYAEGAMLALETNPDDAEAINTIFRAFHTLKGMAAFLGFQMLSELAHHSESLLSRIREGEIRYGEVYADLSLKSVDLCKEIVQGIEDALGGTHGGRIARPAGYDDQLWRLTHVDEAVRQEPSVTDGAAVRKLGEILVAEGKAEAEEIDAVVESQGAEPLGVALVKANVASVTDVAQALREQQKARGGAETVETTVKVRTDRLDRLLNLVGELVIAQSMLDQDDQISSGRLHGLATKIGHAGKVVRELQNLTMAMRMVPLKASFQKMTRLVRDVTRKNGKQVRLETSGEETEIDRTLVDNINEFLVHMVRNSLDHGLETPEERVLAGKTPHGTLRLSAGHRGGNVVFEIEDDGRGLNRERILAKAIEKGIVEAGKQLTNEEIDWLIFAPGFSTAETVTDLSGRGVGMDVVKKGVEALRGRIEIDSRPGQGCKFTMHVPLTMAITDGMVVRVGAEKYIIPILNIKMSLRPAPGQVSTIAGRGEMLMFMETLIPIVRLHRVFEVKGAIENLQDGLLIILEENTRRFACFVDDLVGQVQVVAKTLGEGVGRISGIAAGAILGDGRVGLILDTPGLADVAEGKEARDEARPEN